MAPTQATNPNLSRFFSTAALASLLSALESALGNLALPCEVVRTPAANAGNPDKARLGTLFARLRVKTKDKRGMKLEFAIHVSKGFLPSTETAFAATGGSSNRNPSRLSQQGESMEVDTEGDEGDQEDRNGNENGQGEGDDGLDVTLWKKVAEPIELKKVWKAVMGRLPAGMVTAT